MPFDLGDVVPLTVEIRDEDGALGDPGGIALSIVKPDNTVDTPTPTNPSTGIYRFDYTPILSGRYSVRWVATGINASAYTDAFDVREAVPPLLFSLSDAKSILGRTSATDNEKIRDYLESATDTVEHFVGAVVRRVVSERLEASGMHDYFVPKVLPIITLTSITPIYTGGITYAAGDFDVDPGTGIVQEKHGRVIVGPLRIVYVAGRSIVPAAIRDAGRIILQYYWSKQIGPMGNPREQRPSPTEIPGQAMELLMPYRKAGGFA